MSSGQDERYGRLSTTIRTPVAHGGGRRGAGDDVPDDDDGLIRHELLFDGATVHAVGRHHDRLWRDGEVENRTVTALHGHRRVGNGDEPPDHCHGGWIRA